MSVPGSNILASALTLIASQTVRWYPFAANALDAAGIQVATYTDGGDVRGSWQSVPRVLFEKLGLEFTKDYRAFYTPADLKDIRRSAAPDLVNAYGRQWSVEYATPWRDQDGWQEVVLVDVGVAAVPPAPPPVVP
jgi:hypothetical protein